MPEVRKPSAHQSLVHDKRLWRDSDLSSVELVDHPECLDYFSVSMNGILKRAAVLCEDGFKQNLDLHDFCKLYRRNSLASGAVEKLPRGADIPHFQVNPNFC